MLEKETQKAILDYLTLKRYFFWRNNSGGYVKKYERKDGSQGRGYIQYGALGSPDIFLIKNGFIWGIEVKSPTGVLSAHQESFRDRMREAGGTHITARSLDDVMAAGI